MRRRKISRSGFGMADGSVRMMARKRRGAAAFGMRLRWAMLLICISACANSSLSIRLITALRL
ncbi:Uncharacterised protein [Acinetobacter baumannii]|nr:Uncharacterised protein [Acinetobacter baumannii]